jgi:hypothetical protein
MLPQANSSSVRLIRLHDPGDEDTTVSPETSVNIRLTTQYYIQKTFYSLYLLCCSAKNLASCWLTVRRSGVKAAVSLVDRARSVVLFSCV